MKSKPEKNTTADFWDRAEVMNGRFAMLGAVGLLGAYVVTGQIIPGVF